MMECLQSIDPVRWSFPCSAFVEREQSEGKSKFEAEFVSTLMGINVNTSVNGAGRWMLRSGARLLSRLGGGFTLRLTTQDESVDYSVSTTKTWIQLTSTFFPLELTRRFLKWPLPRLHRSVVFDQSHNDDSFAMQISSLSSLPTVASECLLHLQLCIINYSASERDFTGCRRQLFAISLYRPLLDTIAVIPPLVISVI